jgi:hypothetical protein
VPRSKNVCSALQNSPIVLTACRFIRYIRGRGLLQEDSPGWDGIRKVWVFGAIDMVPLVSWPWVRSYVTPQTYGYPRLPD